MKIEDLKKFGIYGPNKGKFIIVLCSKWCKSCELLSTILEDFRDNGILKLEEIDIDKNSNLARELNIYAVPALIFFKDGMLLNKNIKINEEVLVKKGVMIGAFNELILKEIIRQI
ncbi:MAG: thioredoxin [Promethearchaeota archaeon]|nr:MAG: thioredoxin [Candidatus Lokiarchaeota archaeon]